MQICLGFFPHQAPPRLPQAQDSDPDSDLIPTLSLSQNRAPDRWLAGQKVCGTLLT